MMTLATEATMLGKGTQECLRDAADAAAMATKLEPIRPR